VTKREKKRKGQPQIYPAGQGNPQSKDLGGVYLVTKKQPRHIIERGAENLQTDQILKAKRGQGGVRSDLNKETRKEQSSIVTNGGGGGKKGERKSHARCSMERCKMSEQGLNRCALRHGRGRARLALKLKADHRGA